MTASPSPRPVPVSDPVYGSENDGARKLQVSELKWDEAIYPRSKVDPELVETYVEVLRNGGDFPPVRIEVGTNRILDGVHR